MTIQEAQTISIRESLIGSEVAGLLDTVLEVWNFSRVNIQRFECEAVEIPAISWDVCYLTLFPNSSSFLS
jgi:hypothetical protein